MSESAAKLLRNTAAGLRMKVGVGAVATQAARDLAAFLPKRLTELIDQDLSSGALEQRWKKALEAAKDLGPEAQLGALADILQQEAKVAGRLAIDYMLRVEGDRRYAEGRAAGIEEALGLLEKKDEPAPEKAGAEG